MCLMAQPRPYRPPSLVCPLLQASERLQRLAYSLSGSRISGDFSWVETPAAAHRPPLMPALFLSLAHLCCSTRRHQRSCSVWPTPSAAAASAAAAPPTTPLTQSAWACWRPTSWQLPPPPRPLGMRGPTTSCLAAPAARLGCTLEGDECRAEAWGHPSTLPPSLGCILGVMGAAAGPWGGLLVRGCGVATTTL